MGAARKAKGALLIDHVKIMRTTKDERFYAGLTPEEREVVSSRILPSSWYSYDIYAKTLAPIFRYVCESRPEAAAEMGRLMASKFLEGNYSLYLKEGDPRGTLQNFTVIWQNFFNFGRVEFASEPAAPGAVCLAAAIHEFPDIPRPLCLMIQSFVLRTLELSSATGASISEASCAALGQSCCRYLISWKTPAPPSGRAG